MHSKKESQEATTFAALGLNESILQTLENEGFKTPSPIQASGIPLILSGHDVIGQAQTGTGKTAAFALPCLHLLKNTGGVEVLVITPTRELASQVSDEVSRLGRKTHVKVATIYGGKSFVHQIQSIKKGVQVVVATPGRLLDLLQSRKLENFHPSMVVVDEADEMLDMGFLEDIQAIFEFLPKKRQTLLFSATMPPAIRSLAQKILQNPVLIQSSQEQTSNRDILQSYCIIQDHERDDAIIRLFETKELSKSIIFCKTKKEVDRLTQVLTLRGHFANGLHGDMEQNQREQVIYNFRSGKIQILVATDVAARGLNIVDVSHVLNYHLPFDPESYVHRIGRTGRAGRKGKAVTLVTPKELKKFRHYQQLAGGSAEKETIPTKQEIQQSHAKRLLQDLLTHTPSPQSYDIAQTLMMSMDLELMNRKLLSWILSQKSIEGPEQIGTHEDNFQEKKSKEKRFSKGFRKFSKKEGPSFKRDRKKKVRY